MRVRSDFLPLGGACAWRCGWQGFTDDTKAMGRQVTSVSVDRRKNGVSHHRAFVGRGWAFLRISLYWVSGDDGVCGVMS